MTRVCVIGAGGRMGQKVIELCAASTGAEIVAAVDREGAPSVGATVADGVFVTTDLATAIAAADVYIDFSTPDATRAVAEHALESKTAAVIGTTGLGAAEKSAIATLAEAAPVLWAPNFSLGVNLLLGLARLAARALPDFDIEVVEAHHRQKRDAPSGTALALAAALAEGHDERLDDIACYGREGEVGARPARELGIHAVRGGDVVGEHTAYLFGEGERLELSHRATSRDIFAAGAIRAALWLAGQKPGRYDMADVLGLH